MTDFHQSTFIYLFIIYYDLFIILNKNWIKIKIIDFMILMSNI